MEQIETLAQQIESKMNELINTVKALKTITDKGRV